MKTRGKRGERLAAARRKRKQNPLKQDPTRTAGIRRPFTAALRKRFALLKGRVAALIVGEDAMGLRPTSHDPFTANAGENCGTGAGGFRPGNTCGKGGGVPKELSERWDRQDTAIARQRDAEDDRAEERRDGEDAAHAREGDRLTRAVDKLERTHAREQAKLEDRHDRELQKLQAGQDAESAAIEKRRDREAEPFERSIAHLPAGEQTRRWADYEREQRPAHDQEDRDTAARWDRDAEALAGRHAQEKKAVDDRHAAERESVAGRREDHAIRGKERTLAREAEDRKDRERRDAEDKDIEARRDREYDEWQKTGGGRTGNAVPTANTRWKFATSPEKVKAFQDWLRTQLQSTLTGKTDEELWRKYAEDGFRRGAGRAFDDVKQSQLRKEHPELFTPEAQGSLRDFYQGSKEEFLRSSFARPVAAEKIELLAGRAFDDLEGVTDDMALRMSRVLTDGLVTGAGPHEIARDLNDEIDIGRGRAEMIARTELSRAHAEGQLMALGDLGVEEVGVAVEWLTSGLGVTAKGNPSPCERCAAMQGVVMKLDEATGLIPLHPGCLCSWTPANVAEDEGGQKRGKEEIDAALEEADVDPADVGVDADRPESILNAALLRSPALAAFSAAVANAGGGAEEDTAAVIADILGGLLDEEELRRLLAGELDEPTENYSPDQPRDERGRWASGGTGSLEAASEFLTRHAGTKLTAAKARTLVKHLSGMTLSQLHALKGVHGLKASAPRKAELVAKLAERLREKIARDRPRLKVVETPEAPARAAPLSTPRPAHAANLNGLGRDLHVSDHGAPTVVRHLDHLSRVPAHFHDRMRGAGMAGVYVSDKPVPEQDDNGHLRGKTPRGWEGGQTWDTVAGVYNDAARKVSAGRGLHGSVSLVLHEYGHAVGDRLGLDHLPELADLHKELYPRLSAYERQGGPGAFAGRQEMLAEGFAHYAMDEAVCRRAYGDKFVDWLKGKVGF